jgi:hypothetical protein
VPPFLLARFSSPLLRAWGCVLKQGVVFVRPELAEVAGSSSFFKNFAIAAFLVTEHKNLPPELKKDRKVRSQTLRKKKVWR